MNGIAEPEPERTAPGRAARQLGGRALTIAWIVLGVAVLAAAAWSAWIFIGTNQLAGNRAVAAVESFHTSCSTATEADSTGEVVGLLSFPGKSQTSWPILAGTSGEQLSTGIGWYPQTAAPGQIGNMVLAGYRVTHGAPFANLLDLEVGDEVLIETCDSVFTYQIVVAPRDLTVQAGDDWVLDAVPGEPGRRPTGRMITLITSQDLLPTADRSVGFGQLVSAQPR